MSLKTLKNFVTTFNEKIDKPLQLHLRRVYACLTAAALAASLGAYTHMFTDLLQHSFVTTLGAVALLLVLKGTADTAENRARRVAYLLGFAFLCGLSLGPLLALAHAIDPSLIPTALTLSIAVFAAFSMSALFAKERQYLYLGGLLLSGVNVLLGMAVFALLFGANRALLGAHAYLSLAVFAGFVLFDTQMIVEKRRMGDQDFIWHSVELFMDLFEIFRAILVILLNKNERRQRRD